jgi:hypothetical protein
MKGNTETKKRKKKRKKQISRVNLGRLRFACDRTKEVRWYINENGVLWRAVLLWAAVIAKVSQRDKMLKVSQHLKVSGTNIKSIKQFSVWATRHDTTRHVACKTTCNHASHLLPNFWYWKLDTVESGQDQITGYSDGDDKCLIIAILG